jgi:hypothetical protein
VQQKQKHNKEKQVAEEALAYELVATDDKSITKVDSILNKL